MISHCSAMISYLTLSAMILFVSSINTEGSVCLNASAKDLLITEDIWRTTSGKPIGDLWNALTAGPRGPMLLEDLQYIDSAAQFNRRKTLERVVHTKGNTAFGYFEVMDDITRYTKANVFDRIGKKTPVAVRFSKTFGEKGSSDTVREIRGFGIKFYTEEGNWDLVGLNFPVFFARDPMVIVNVGKVLGTNPVSGTRLNTRTFWTFLSLVPESMAVVILLFSSKGIPLSYRHIDGFAVNTFTLINAKGETFYCKFNYLTNQGARNMTKKKALKLAALDPYFHGRDLYRAIESQDFPSWTLFIQVMTEEQAKEVSFNPFDPTKEWNQTEFPMIRVGRIVLNRNPTDFDTEVEQIALCPSNLVPGIQPSPDKILQGRILAYPDAHRHRLGVNFHRIPINSPLQPPLHSWKAGFAENTEGKLRSSVNILRTLRNEVALETPYDVCGQSKRHDSLNEDNFSQARIYYKNLDETEKNNLIENLLEGLEMASNIPEEVFDYFQQVDVELGRRILEAFREDR
ncbi:catalase-like [Uloborus diversus]|uniref:catalase-like n=1 Tax=Uloborus diversus TaxID=327109 RepID=UPI0024097825|nr:catalase-like [Uloborus diversus]